MFLIGHLDTSMAPNHSSFNRSIHKSVSLDRNGNLQTKKTESSPDNHSSLTARIIFEDTNYSLPALSSMSKLAAVSVPIRGKTLLNLLKGMDLLLGFVPKIVCMPIGFRKLIPIFYPMICAFHDKEIMVIVPIGNSGEENAHSPGCYPNVISVGAIDPNGKVAQYSGSYLDDSGNCLKPDILALGNSLSISEKKIKKGTSFACSYITGIVARLMQAQPSVTSKEIKQALFSTTQPLDTLQSNRCKRGIVQPDAALKYLFHKKKSTSSKSKQQNSIPSFLDKPYQDNRFLFQYRNAKPDQFLEAIIIPLPSQGKLKSSQTSSPRSHDLIAQIQKENGFTPDKIHYFIHADMAHIIASPTFFEALLNNPNLFSISAVDVNIFEM